MYFAFFFGFRSKGIISPDNYHTWTTTTKYSSPTWFERKETYLRLISLCFFIFCFSFIFDFFLKRLIFILQGRVVYILAVLNGEFFMFYKRLTFLRKKKKWINNGMFNKSTITIHVHEKSLKRSKLIIW
jgi:hypothetical protein